MWLQWVELDRFRNLKRQRVPLHPRYNLLLGRNGQGKTNFLEAVGYLGSLRSFRSAGRNEMIGHREEMCRVSGSAISGELKWTLAFALTRRGRAQFLDERKITSPEEYLQALKVVHFIPEDVGLVGGSPSWRRKVVDRSVFEITPGYVSEYRSYLQALRQRNALLRKGKPAPKELDSWNGALAAAGARLVWRRQQFLRGLNPVMEKMGERLGLGPGLGLSYRPSHQPGASAASGGRLPERGAGEAHPPRDAGSIESGILETLGKLEAREARSGYTMAGPHRDDMIFTLWEEDEERDLARYGSQGQKRSAVLAFKLALAVVFQRANGAWPVVLLDDVASELDATRRKALGAIVRETEAQFFISTTGEEYMFLPAAEGKIFEVVDGWLKEFKAGGKTQPSTDP